MDTKDTIDPKSLEVTLRDAPTPRSYGRYTARFRPWILKTCIAFDDKAKAKAFEKYLKHGSGHAFANKHFW